MLRIIQHTILYIAYATFLMHSLIPHQHHTELNSTKHECKHTSKNVIDFLRTIFHIDFGNVNHLENYEIHKNNTSKIAQIEYPSDTDDISSSLHLVTYFDADCIQPISFLFKTNLSNAPPFSHYFKIIPILFYQGFSTISLRAP